MNRKRLTVAAAALIALATASLARAQETTNTATFTAAIRPALQPKPNTGRASLEFVVTTGATEPNPVSPMTRAIFYFDNDLHFRVRGLPQCPPLAITGKNTEQAKAVCGRAIVGSGSALIALQGDPADPSPLTITAFNGTSQGGAPVLLLHTYSPEFGIGTVMHGHFGQSPAPGYGTSLDFSVPVFPFKGAITNLQVKLSRTFVFRGNRRHYLYARCFDRNHTWDYIAVLEYEDGGGLVVTSSQRCSVRGFYLT
jgi:hypothetical protein